LTVKGFFGHYPPIDFASHFSSAAESPLPCSPHVNLVKHEALYLSWNETTHALFLVASAAKRFTVDTNRLESGSPMATSAAYIQNRLIDAHASLTAAEAEMARLMQRSTND